MTDVSSATIAEQPALPEPVGCEWLCWCSHQNGAEAKVCTACTTPRALDDKLQNSACDQSTFESKGETEESLAPCERILALVVRADANMGAGKIAEQCCLATLSSAWSATQQPPATRKALAEWRVGGQTKAVFQCEGASTFTKLQARAAVCGVPALLIQDKGEPTVLAVGPATASELELVTGQLQTLDWHSVDAVDGQGMESESLTTQRTLALSLLQQVLHAEPDTETKKIKPNAKCPCGSSKKYKKCCSSKDLAKKEKQANLNKVLTTVLGKSAMPTTNSSTSGQAQFHHARGERVLAFRKQGEYGAKKYIKP